jgi:DNA/RNA endonuclease YhcR with UshA esterase domain
MKKSVLVFSMTLLLIFSGFNVAAGQEQPKPKQDTVNMDTNAKPTYYYPVEDEKKGKSPITTIVIVVGAVVVVGAGSFFLLKKKK